MGELGAEAQVGVQEVEQEVEGPLLNKVGDEPEQIQGVPKKAHFQNAVGAQQSGLGQGYLSKVP